MTNTLYQISHTSHLRVILTSFITINCRNCIEDSKADKDVCLLYLKIIDENFECLPFLFLCIVSSFINHGSKEMMPLVLTVENTVHLFYDSVSTSAHTTHFYSMGITNGDRHSQFLTKFGNLIKAHTKELKFNVSGINRISSRKLKTIYTSREFNTILMSY